MKYRNKWVQYTSGVGFVRDGKLDRNLPLHIHFADYKSNATTRLSITKTETRITDITNIVHTEPLYNFDDLFNGRAPDVIITANKKWKNVKYAISSRGSMPLMYLNIGDTGFQEGQRLIISPRKDKDTLSVADIEIFRLV